MAQRHVEALKYARNLIENNYRHYKFICIALNSYQNNNYCTFARYSANQVKDYIATVLAKDETNNVECWLTRKGYYSPFMSTKLLREYRLRWIDHMILNHEEFFGKD